MATTVVDEKEFTLQDDEGTVVTVRPLVISRLRKFAKVMERFAKVQEEMLEAAQADLEAANEAEKKGEDYEDTFDPDAWQDRALEVLVEAVAWPLQRSHAKFKDVLTDQGKLAKGGKELIEDSIDPQTMWAILDVAGGVKADDPSLRPVASQ